LAIPNGAEAGAMGRVASGRGWLVILGVILAAGLAVRLYGLTDRTLTHPEVYVPRIELPDYVTSPPRRLTLAETVLGTVDYDKHPPAFYVLMWVWTGLVGTGLFVIRLPSVVLGTATIGLLYWMGRREGGPWVGLVAAGLLALNGQHVFWSQHARMWVWLALLAVASTNLLRAAARHAGGPVAAAYVLVTGVGLWTEYYYWPLFAAQVIWTLSRGLWERSWPEELSAQTLAFVLASPVLLMLRLHSGGDNHLDSNALPYVVELLGFGQLLNPRLLVRQVPYGGAVIAGLLAVLGAWWTARGILAEREEFVQARVQRRGDGAELWWICAHLVAGLLVSALYATYGRAVFSWKLSAAGFGLAWAAIGGWYVCRRFWTTATQSWLSAAGSSRFMAWIVGDLVAVQALLPLLTLVALSVTIPTLASRALLILVPFYLVLISRGIMEGVTRKHLQVATLVGLFILSLGSLYQHGTRANSLTDYQSLAQLIIPMIGPGDVIVVENTWWAAPIHYYLKPTRFQVIDPGALVDVLHSSSTDGGSPRVWVLAFGAEENRTAQIRKLAGEMVAYSEARHVEVRGGVAVLFERLRAT